MNKNIKYLIESFINDEEEITDIDLNFDREGFVNLGLPSGTLWAKCNLGAKSPEEEGDYFSWGETFPKTEFFINNHIFYKLKYGSYTKYNHTDKLNQLEPEDDAAYKLTNGKYVIPSYELMRELVNNTEILFSDDKNGKRGFLFLSNNNNNSLFIPCNSHYKDGRKYYAGNYKDSFACWLRDRGDAAKWPFAMVGNYKPYSNLSDKDLYVKGDDDCFAREDGLPIRPVLNKNN